MDDDIKTEIKIQKKKCKSSSEFEEFLNSLKQKFEEKMAEQKKYDDHYQKYRHNRSLLTGNYVHIEHKYANFFFPDLKIPDSYINNIDQIIATQLPIYIDYISKEYQTKELLTVLQVYDINSVRRDLFTVDFYCLFVLEMKKLAQKGKPILFDDSLYKTCFIEFSEDEIKSMGFDPNMVRVRVLGIEYFKEMTPKEQRILFEKYVNNEKTDKEINDERKEYDRFSFMNEFLRLVVVRRKHIRSLKKLPQIPTKLMNEQRSFLKCSRSDLSFLTWNNTGQYEF